MSVWHVYSVITSKQNGDQPATQKDLSLLAGRFQEQFDDLKQGQARLETRIDGLDTRMDGLGIRMDKLETRFDNFDSRMESLENGQAAILQTVNSIDQQLKEWQHIPAKVERLHTRVFGTSD